MSDRNMIKEANLKKLRTILRQERISTKSQLSELSGLSVVTIQSLVKTLLDNGELTEDDILKPQLGRPAVTYRYNAAFRLALIINMCEHDGTDTAQYMVYNLYGECLESRQEPLPVVTLESYHTTIEALLKQYPQICVIGFGLPGNEIGGKLLVSDYANLKNAELGPYYQQRFHIPVFVENDINAAILGYCVNRGYPSDSDFYIAGLYIPSKYPAGAGLCHNFEIIKGRNGLAGELRYLPLGIDWNTFSFSREELFDFAIKTIRVLMSIYNPERIVIYQEEPIPNIGERLRALCGSDIERLMLPEIEQKNSLREDFNTGLIRLALERILL